MTQTNKKRNWVLITIYLAGLICLAVLLYLDEHLFFMEPSHLLDILALAVFLILSVTIFKIGRRHICLAAVLTIPLLLYCGVHYLNHFREQQGHRFAELANKGYLLGSYHIIPGFLDNSCYERSYYLPPGSIWREFIAKLAGCNDECSDIEISEIKVSNPLVILKINSCSFQNLYIRSKYGKWRGFHVPPIYEGYESSEAGFDLFFEDFDYNAGSYAIEKYRLTPDGSRFKYDSQRLLDTPGCKEIKQIVELAKTDGLHSHVDAVTKIKSIGGPCAEKYLSDFAYSANDVKVRNLARQALGEMAIRSSPEELSKKVQAIIETKQIDDIDKLVSPDAVPSSIQSLKEMLSLYIGAKDLSVNVVPKNDMDAQWKFLSGSHVPGIIMPLDDRVKKYESEGNYFGIIPLGDIVISGKQAGAKAQRSKSSIMYGVWNAKYVITFAKKKGR